MTAVYPRVDVDRLREEWSEYYPGAVGRINKDNLETMIYDDPDVDEAVSRVIETYLRGIEGGGNA
ncbi:MAG: hypothetical protein MPK62_00970 [Alphaproteobacteria bacterium]|nr:hypothetical protein [Alphaproteobacteria bacterium]MDA8029706.1 hypothetical protein [Alphaproteobacteria bacterium]